MEGDCDGTRRRGMKGACKSTSDQAARDARGRFLKGRSGNPAGRSQGATCNALRMAREAAETVALPVLIEAAKAGDLDACKTLIAYGLPRQRPVTVPEPISLPVEGSLADQARALVALVARGEVSTATAGEVADVLQKAAKVDEVTQLREQVEALRRLLDNREEQKRVSNFKKLLDRQEGNALMNRVRVEFASVERQEGDDER